MERMTTKYAKYTKTEAGGRKPDGGLPVSRWVPVSCGSRISWCQAPCLRMTTKHAKYAKGGKIQGSVSGFLGVLFVWFEHFVISIPLAYNSFYFCRAIRKTLN